MFITWLFSWNDNCNNHLTNLINVLLTFSQMSWRNVYRWRQSANKVNTLTQNNNCPKITWLDIALKQKKQKHKRMLTLRLITSLLYDHSDKEQEIRLKTEFARARPQFNDSLIPVSRSLASVGWFYALTSQKYTWTVTTIKT